MFRSLTEIFILLALLFPAVHAQYESPGYFTMNASIPSSSSDTSGCIILAQLTTSPPTIQAMLPICPPGRTNGQHAYTVKWPIASNSGLGDGASSQLLIYGQIGKTGGAGCVMTLTEGQQQYLVVNKKVVEWNNDLQELWDTQAKGLVMNGTGGGPLTCIPSKTYLPSSLVLPDPYSLAATDPTWQIPIALSTAGITKAASGSKTALRSSSSASAIADVANTSKPTMTETASASLSSSSPIFQGTGLHGVQTFTCTINNGAPSIHSTSPSVVSSPTSSSAPLSSLTNGVYMALTPTTNDATSGTGAATVTETATVTESDFLIYTVTETVQPAASKRSYNRV